MDIRNDLLNRMPPCGNGLVASGSVSRQESNYCRNPWRIKSRKTSEGNVLDVEFYGAKGLGHGFPCFSFCAA